jgi:hypothetical protein
MPCSSGADFGVLVAPNAVEGPGCPSFAFLRCHSRRESASDLRSATERTLVMTKAIVEMRSYISVDPYHRDTLGNIAALFVPKAFQWDNESKP